MDKFVLNQQLINYASAIDLKVLQSRINNFRKLNKIDMSYLELRKKVHDVITFNNKSVIEHNSTIYPSGSLLFRVRRLDNDIIPNKDMKVTSDAWNAPQEDVKSLGRINKKHETLLYVSPNILTSIKEARVKRNDSFALIVYKIIKPVKAINIATGNNYSNYPSEIREKLNLVQSFLKEEFSKKTSNGNNNVYTVSEILTKEFFDGPPRTVQDAWSYISTLNKPFVNLCFRPDIAKEMLSLKGVQIIAGYQLEGDFLISAIKSVARPNQNGIMEYFPIGSEEQKRMFPDI